MNRAELFILAIIALLLIGVNGAGADNPADFIGSSWVVSGRGAVNVSGIGRIPNNGMLTVFFNEDGTVDMTDEAGYVIQGNYGFDSNGRPAIDIPIENVQQFLEEYVPNEWPLVNAFFWDIDVRSSQIRTRTKYNRDGTLGLSIILRFSTVINCQEQGRNYRFRMLFSVNASGDRLLNATAFDASQEWAINGRRRISGRGVRVLEMCKLKLVLGEHNGSSPGANQYRLYLDDGADGELLIEGMYSRSQNKVTFGGDDSDIYSIIQGLAEQNGSGLLIYDSNSKMTATVADGHRIRLIWRNRFWGNLDAGGQQEETTGTFTMSGSGVPAH